MEAEIDVKSKEWVALTLGRIGKKEYNRESTEQRMAVGQALKTELLSFPEDLGVDESVWFKSSRPGQWTLSEKNYYYCIYVVPGLLNFLEANSNTWKHKEVLLFHHLGKSRSYSSNQFVKKNFFFTCSINESHKARSFAEMHLRS